MIAFTTRRRGRGRSPVATLALACAGAGLTLAVALPVAGARDARVLGKTQRDPNPNCPRNCFAVGSVTGFQTQADGERGIFKMPVDGRIVAWSIEMSRVRPDDREFFGSVFRNDQFGRDPSARIAVLRKVGRMEFRLIAQSDAINLSRHYGEEPVVTNHPALPAQQGDVVAITYPTWAANLEVDPPGRNSWRASRRRGECGGNAARDARPQQNVGSTREYGCAFTDRLAYNAYYVPN